MPNDGGHEPGEPHRGSLAWWHRTPLYVRVLVALLLGAVVGVLLGERAAILKEPSRLVLRLLGAVAPPLILVAVVHALLHADIKGRTGLRLVGLLATNTLVAIGIGLLVANVLQPGHFASLGQGQPRTDIHPLDPWSEFTDKIPTSLLKPLVDNNVISVILIALAFGVALRRVRQQQASEGRTGYRIIEDIVDTAFRSFMVIIHWIIDVVPIAVFGIVAATVGKEGFAQFKALGAFVVAVLAALLLQATYYLTRTRLQSWVRPMRFLKGGRDALTTAFSTASSTATMPITYMCLKDRVGVREQSASMGALVGSNFNNDGTALYEAMAALFIAQVVGLKLSLAQQAALVLTSVVASVGAPGIPEAGLVTMTLVFTAARLPVQYIPLLLTVDWFLDRCRTAINVMGDMTVSCVLDGKVPEDPTPDASALAVSAVPDSEEPKPEPALS